jgi:hypothetical protein
MKQATWRGMGGGTSAERSIDDHSGLNLGGRFVPVDTPWAHFYHFRAISEHHGLPEAISNCPEYQALASLQAGSRILP